MDFKALGFKVIGWLFAGLFAVATIGSLTEGGGLWTFLIGVVLVALCAPPSRAWMVQKTRIPLKGAPLAIVCFILLVVQMSILSTGAEEKKVAKEAAEKKALEDQIKKTRETNLAYFEANKDAVLKDIADKMAAGKSAEALAVASKYASVSKDPDLARAKRMVLVQQAREQLKDEDSVPLAKRVELYKALVDNDPSDTVAASKAKELGEQLEKQVAAQRAAQAAATAAASRKQAIEAQFSGWDGSHRRVEAAVKQFMKNPDSYQHVQTKYIDTGSKIIVTTTIRGTNSFGAVVPSTFVAEVDVNGNVLSISESR